MELFAKVADAGSMLWQALDERERMLVLYGAGWLVLALLVGLRKRERDALRDDVLEELAARGAGSRD